STGLCALAFIRNPRPAADGPPDGKGPDAGRFRGGAAGPTAGGLAGGEMGSAGGKMPVRGPGVGGGTGPLPDGAAGPYVWLLFLLPLAVSCSQGILFFELPLMNPTAEGASIGRFRGGAAGPTAGGLAGGETGSAGGKMPVRGPGVGGGTGPLPDGAAGPYVWLLFLLPLAVSCSQGILFFELPLMNPTAEGA